MDFVRSALLSAALLALASSQTFTQENSPPPNLKIVKLLWKAQPAGAASALEKAIDQLIDYTTGSHLVPSNIQEPHMLIARRLCLAVLLAVPLCFPTALPLQAQDKPTDAQGGLQKQVPALRDLDSHCPFTPPTSIEAWQARGAQVKQQMQVAMGLWPMPKLEPVQPKIYGKIDLSKQVEGLTLKSRDFH